MKVKLWIVSYVIGFAIVGALILLDFLSVHLPHSTLAILEVVGGVMLIAGSCEAFVIAVEGIAHNMNLTDYVSGIYASLAAVIPELSILTFLIINRQYELAWVLALATIFVNSLVFAIYSLFLPKDEQGNYKLPDAIMWVGSDLLSMGAVISLAVGLSMMIVHSFVPSVTVFTGDELLVFGLCLIGVFIAYLYHITKYFGKRKVPAETDADMPPVAGNEHAPITKQALAVLLVVASIGSMFGGEALASFATYTTDTVGLNFIQAALLLVIFGGTPEYIIVASSHRKKKLEVALSNAFGGIVQVFFVVFGYTLLATAFFGGSITIDLFSVVLLFFAFPSMFILRVMIVDDQKINNLEAVSMIAVFIMMLYMLLTFGIQAASGMPLM